MTDRDSDRIDRRGLLRVGGTLALVAVPGCSGLGSGGQSSSDSTDTETYTLTVRLEDPDGDPVTEAVVTISAAGERIPPVQAQAPDENGIVTVELERGNYTAQTRSQEYASASESFTLDGNVTVTLTLERGINYP